MKNIPKFDCIQKTKKKQIKKIDVADIWLSDKINIYLSPIFQFWDYKKVWQRAVV